MPSPLVAGGWGLVAGSALILGSGLAYIPRLPQRLIAAVMAFGSGVLISALSFSLMNEAYQRGGLVSTGVGFLAGATIYTIANIVLSRHGAKHRKRSGSRQPSEKQAPGSGLAIAVGSLLDSIPESMVIGLTLLSGAVSMVAVIAISLSNIPEGLASASGMRQAGRGVGYIFGVWGSIALACGLASLLGFALFRGVPGGIVAATTALAAGAILAMLADTMIPEAFEHAHNYAGLITVVGFLAAFVLGKYA